MTDIRPCSTVTLCVALLLGTALSTTRAAAQPRIGSSAQPIIYGQDDRHEVYESPVEEWQQLARQSVLALVPASNLVERSDGSFEPIPGALGDIRLCAGDGACVAMCTDEPFLEQPSIADCSGVLVDDDLVLTAGHCFSHVGSCAAYAYVFDYYYEGPGELARIDPEDVYGCRRIVRQELSEQVGQEAQDYALIQLDRPVDSQRKPVELRADRMRKDDSVTAIGYAIGLPAKIDTGGVVQDASKDMPDFFTATTDTFVGNSGSAIFDDQGRLAGHLVLGGQDFSPDSLAGSRCLRSVVVPDETTPPLYEHIVYTDVWRQPLCRSRWPSARLCGANGDGCGDGVCAGVETQKSCAHDCDEPLCEGADCVHQAALLPEFEGAKGGGGCSAGRGAASVPLPGLAAFVLWFGLRRRRRLAG